MSDQVTWARPAMIINILVLRAHAPFGQYQESQPLGWSNTESPQFTYFTSSLTNLIGREYKTMLCACSESRVWPEFAIGHVQYINILTWLWGFQVKCLYLAFSFYLCLFWELRAKENSKTLQFWPESLRAMLEY